MDYNPYNPINPMTYMNPYPNNLTPTYRNPVPSQLPGPQLDKVNGIDSARAFPMKPNSTIALFDANEDIMYIKSTDVNNFATIRRFRFYEEPEVPQQKTDIVPMTDLYVTKDEFDKFREEVLNGQQSIRTDKFGKSTNGKHRSNEPGSTDQKSDGNGPK